MNTMSIDNLRNLIQDCIEVGYMRAVKDYDSEEDSIRATQVDNWLRKNNIAKKIFKALVENGKIIGRRKGFAQNSPIYFSKAEIKSAIMVENNAIKIFGL